MRKKLVTIGMVAMFIVVFFVPLTIATTPSNTRLKEEPIPAATTVYAYAIVNGTINDPHSIYLFLNLLNPFLVNILQVNFMITANFTEGTIKPVYSFPIFPRNITIPGEHSLAVIRGSFCKWDKFEQVGDTNNYNVSGKIVHLTVDLY
jgi:hypothetical protein